MSDDEKPIKSIWDFYNPETGWIEIPDGVIICYLREPSDRIRFVNGKLEKLGEAPRET